MRRSIAPETEIPRYFDALHHWPLLDVHDFAGNAKIAEFLFKKTRLFFQFFHGLALRVRFRLIKQV